MATVFIFPNKPAFFDNGNCKDLYSMGKVYILGDITLSECIKPVCCTVAVKWGGKNDYFLKNKFFLSCISYIESNAY